LQAEGAKKKAKQKRNAAGEFRRLRTATRAPPLDPASLWKGLTETLLNSFVYCVNLFFCRP